MNNVSLKTQKDIDYLLSFSGDAIASLSLVKDYDMKKLAFIIDNLFGQYGILEFQEVAPPEEYTLINEKYN